MAIPKIIWFTWLQGLGEAPEVVRACHQSWVARNPGWKVVSLDEASAQAYASVDYSQGHFGSLTPQQKSDLLRLDLLSHHGGVWADATCYCAQPLDEWLPQQTGSGFFAFAAPGRDRLLSSWFLAAEPNCLLTGAWFALMRTYWDRPWRTGTWSGRRMRAVLSRLLGRSPHSRAAWFTWPLTTALRVSPYFAVHYGFEKLVRNDPECARLWDATPRVSADGPHILLRAGLSSPLTSPVRAAISEPAAPVWKLRWTAVVSSESVLSHLLQR